MMNMHGLIKFFKHRFHAKNRHGIHSPFVYHLLDSIIYDFGAKAVYQEIEQLRNDLLRDKRRKNHTKSASGSDHDMQRSISVVAKSVLKPARRSRLLYRLAADLKPGTIIELGASLGITTAYLAKAAPGARFINIMEFSETLAIAEENLQKLNIRGVELQSGNTDELLPKFLDGIPELDFILIDGNHSRVAILNYFKSCLPKMSKHSMMVFEDIYQSKEMNSAWTEIKSNPEVSVTIDLFWIGLVFVGRAQSKEDFFIRF